MTLACLPWSCGDPGAVTKTLLSYFDGANAPAAADTEVAPGGGTASVGSPSNATQAWRGAFLITVRDKFNEGGRKIRTYFVLELKRGPFFIGKAE